MSNRTELLGLAEVATLLNVSRQTISNWRQRGEDFPAPVAELKSGPIWQREQIITWAEENEMELTQTTEEGTDADVNPAVTVAVANMKGGVGKSTLTYNLGSYFSYRKDMNVLLVDLDPQFNLSQYSMGATAYEQHLDNDKPTVLDIFERFTPSAVSRVKKGALAPDDVIVPVRKPYRGGILSLIPSRLELAWTLKNPHNKEHLLNDFLDEVREDYDLIFIDCPPTDSMLTDASYLASDAVLVPVKPEYLSAIGLPLLVRSLEGLEKLYKHKKVEVAGIVFNDSSDKQEHDRSRAFVKKVAKENGWYVFKHEVHHSDSYPKGARLSRPIFMTDYARYERKTELTSVANELAARLGL